MEPDRMKNMNQLMLAFKSLNRSVEKSIHSGVYQGAGDTAVRNYQALYKRASQLLPEDFYISDVLTLEIPTDATDKQKLSQVSLVSSQMVDYLKSIINEEAKASFAGEFEDLKGFGREFQDQILSLTRNTLRRALENVDVTVNVPTPPKPKKPPVPPEPPIPPVPPQPFDEPEDNSVV